MTGPSPAGTIAETRCATVAVTRSVAAPFTFERLQLLPPAGTEVLVEIGAVGMCHADLAARGGGFPVPLPAVLGHEGAGVVVAIGPGVRSLQPGDHVVLTFASCGDCRSCRDGWPTRCERHLTLNFGSSNGVPEGGPWTGFFGQSSFSTHSLVQERNVVGVPADLPFEMLAPLGCAVQTGVGAVVNVARPGPGSTVAVIGLGPVGLSAVLGAALTLPTENIIAVDVNPDRLDIAARCGAGHVINASKESTVQRIRDIHGGVDIVIECSGRETVLPDLLGVLRKGGTAVLAGVPAFGTTAALDIAAMVNGSITLRGTVEGDSKPHIMIPWLAELVRSGRLPIGEMVRSYPLTAIEQAARDMSDGRTIKPVLLPADPQRPASNEATIAHPWHAWIAAERHHWADQQ